MSLLAAFFVLRFVPETKGRTLESMQELWSPGGAQPVPAAAASPLQDVAVAGKLK